MTEWPDTEELKRREGVRLALERIIDGATGDDADAFLLHLEDEGLAVVRGG